MFSDVNSRNLQSIELDLFFIRHTKLFALKTTSFVHDISKCWVRTVGRKNKPKKHAQIQLVHKCGFFPPQQFHLKTPQYSTQFQGGLSVTL